MEITNLENLLMIFNRDLENMYGKIKMFIKEILKIQKNKEKVNWLHLMEINMKDSLKIIKFMGLDKWLIMKNKLL